MTENNNLMESAMDQLLNAEPEQTEEQETVEEVIEEEQEAENEEVSETEEGEESEQDEEEAEETEEEGEVIDFDELKGKKIKVGEEELDFNDLKDGYMRQQDYTKKTQALAEQRDTYTSAADALKESGERLNDMYKDTEALFGALQSSATQEVAAIDEQLKNVDWSNLSDSEVKVYLGLKNKREEVVKNYTVTVEKMNEIKTNYDSQLEAQKQEMVKVESKKLQEKYPVFKDEVKGKEIKEALGKYLETAYGEDAGKVSQNLIDHRDVDILLKAYLYDEGQKKQAPAKKAKKPELKKSSTRGNADDAKTRKNNNAKYKAKQKGGRQASASYLENILFN